MWGILCRRGGVDRLASGGGEGARVCTSVGVIHIDHGDSLHIVLYHKVRSPNCNLTIIWNRAHKERVVGLVVKVGAR